MIDFEPYYTALGRTAIAPFVQHIRHSVELKLDKGHGDFPHWDEALAQLPDIAPTQVLLDVDCLRIGSADEVDETQRSTLRTTLLGLHPWRKGPFEIFGIHIDSEWRSDLKWRRLAGQISPLRDRLVLDVGSGNGYYALRMKAAGARFVLGIDPTWLFVLQFEALNKYVATQSVFVAPLALEELPTNMGIFDTVFSMGVLYHRRSPVSHLLELWGTLRPGGELVLETLVIEPQDGSLLMPADRYAKMRNAWFIPTTELLIQWLTFVGFTESCVIDVTPTTANEQRATEWMHFESLADFLDPNDSSKTAEGLPAPRRAIIRAKKPH
jgi:tRNA (mo5U34)-methyltransferase